MTLISGVTHEASLSSDLVLSRALLETASPPEHTENETRETHEVNHRYSDGQKSVRNQMSLATNFLLQEIRPPPISLLCPQYFDHIISQYSPNIPCPFPP